MMVSLDSARQWYPREKLIACDADHSQIAKLKRGESSIYPDIKRAIRQAMLTVGDLYSEVEGKPNNRVTSPSHGPDTTDPRELLAFDHSSLGPSKSRPSPSVLRESIIDRDRNALFTGSSASDDHETHTSSSFPLRAHKAISQWQNGIKNYVEDGLHSQSSPSVSTESPEPSDAFDKRGVASRSFESVTTTGIEAHKASTPFSIVQSTSESRLPIVMREPAFFAGNTKPGIHPESVDCAAIPAEAAQSCDTQKSPEVQQASMQSIEKADVDTVELVAVNASNSEIAIPAAKSSVFEMDLKLAILQGNIEITQRLLASTYDIDCKDDTGVTPLLYAAYYRHEHIVKILLEYEPFTKAKDKRGSTTLHQLAFKNSGRVISSGPQRPLTESLINLLLQHRPPLGEKEESGRTPLMIAAMNGEEILVMKLIDYGADIEASDPTGYSAIHLAAYYGKKPEMITLLLKAGIQVNCRSTNSHQTPLHLAAKNRADAVDIVECLLQAGAEKDARNQDGWTPLYNAAIRNNNSCLILLLKSGANIEAKTTDSWERTPLHVASARGNLSTVKLLLAHGANPCARARENHVIGRGETPKSMAAEKRQAEGTPAHKDQKEIIDLLKDAEKAWKKAGKKTDFW